MILDQIKKLRSLAEQQKSDYESKLAASQEIINNLTNNAITPDVEAELNAFEAELTPAVKTDV